MHRADEVAQRLGARGDDLDGAVDADLTRDALEPLVQEEVRTLLDRLAGEVDVERAVEIIAAGAEPLRDLIGAMHSKLLLAELRRQHD